jgi:hypothetical protein
VGSKFEPVTVTEVPPLNPVLGDAARFGPVGAAVVVVVELTAVVVVELTAVVVVALTPVVVVVALTPVVVVVATTPPKEMFDVPRSVVPVANAMVHESPIAI